MKLDRDRKYGHVYGDETERYYQDGNFYSGQGEFIRSASGSRVEPVGDDDGPADVAELIDGGKAERIKELRLMSVNVLRKMVDAIEEATGKKAPDAGIGAKARYVTYVAENTD